MLAVADLLIAETPGGIVRWSIDTFGASQKTVLVAGIVIAALLVGAVLGVLARRRLRRGRRGAGGLRPLGGWAAGRTTLTSDTWGWVAAGVSAAAGVGALAMLLPRSTGRRCRPSEMPWARGRIGTVDRRRFLVVSGAVAAVGAVGGGIGRLVRQARNVEDAAASGSPPSLGTDVPHRARRACDLSTTRSRASRRLVTPNADFYRIDTAHRRSPGRPRRLVAADHRDGRPTTSS